MDTAVYIRQAVEKKLDSAIFLVKRNERYMEETRENLTVVSKKDTIQANDSQFQPVISKKEYEAMRKLYNEKLIQTLEKYVEKIKGKADVNVVKIQNLNNLLDRTIIDLEEEYGFYRDMIHLVKTNPTTEDMVRMCSGRYRDIMDLLKGNRSEIEEDLAQLKKRMKAI